MCKQCTIEGSNSLPDTLGATASEVICDINTPDGNPFAGDPCGVLKKVIGRVSTLHRPISARTRDAREPVNTNIWEMSHREKRRLRIDDLPLRS